jgi:hypothetical protein
MLVLKRGKLAKLLHTSAVFAIAVALIPCKKFFKAWRSRPAFAEHLSRFAYAP